MIFEVRFTIEAKETYSSLSKQLLNRWGEKFVREFENKVSKAVAVISKSPDIYPVINKVTEVRKCILHKNISMYYVIVDNYISVICFWDNRQDPIFLP